MDLMSLNDQIVAMRKPIRNAKLLIIRQLVRRIKQLRNKKGTEEQKQKNGRKADRLQSKIAEIRKLDLDKLAVGALRDLKIPPSTKISPENDFEKLFKCKKIIGAVEAFRTKYPKWQDELTILLKMRDVRRKFNQSKSTEQSNSQKETKPKMLDGDAPSVSTDAEEKLLDGDAPSVSTDAEEKLLDGDAPSVSAEEKGVVTSPVPSAVKQTKRKKQMQQKKKKQKNVAEKFPAPWIREMPLVDNLRGEIEVKKLSLDEGVFDDRDSPCFTKTDSKKEEKPSPVAKRLPSSKLKGSLLTSDNEPDIDMAETSDDGSNFVEHGLPSSKLKESFFLTSDDKLNSSNEEIQKSSARQACTERDSKTEEKLPPVAKSSKPKDSFFLTSDNESGGEAASDDEVDLDKFREPAMRPRRFPYPTEDSIYRKRNETNRRSSKVPERNRQFSKVPERNQQFSKVPIRNERNRQFGNKRPMQKEFPKRGRDFKPARIPEPVQEKEETLHPSWEAKRKLKTPQITQFEGKKIVFDF